MGKKSSDGSDSVDILSIVRFEIRFFPTENKIRSVKPAPSPPTITPGKSAPPSRERDCSLRSGAPHPAPPCRTLSSNADTYASIYICISGSPDCRRPTQEIGGGGLAASTSLHSGRRKGPEGASTATALPQRSQIRLQHGVHCSPRVPVPRCTAVANVGVHGSIHQ
jgi:hypothetical protein